ncbi:aminopeptidase [Paenibacillus jamilae]|uniref:aminopeptidase n=1 Tax=Paenibacillus TaxID=44249 RepID=UPI000D326764|nr:MULTISPECIES: aminopeptidase [Paenibacillus]MDP9679042.1 aminopeptidase [Paenibacillus jamilae]KAF6614859.1 aminopeptidase [Paenibacillus sp. EKM101P]KAF6618054.1 aminopeptidase [Paenibacillus sp. EKM102P]KAF6626245.1 aminopeptidase [Paenibacillus sp. EKM10P]KAF6642701.1 aminopeptidase [Paenibacillus sp. EKM11P]
MSTFESLLEQYAELVVRVGVNIQPGQALLVTAPLETVEFTRLIVSKAYEAGAKYVQVEFEDDSITRSRFEHGDEASFDYYPAWKAEMMEKFAEEGGATLTIKVPNPDLYQGIDPEHVSRATKAAATAREGYAHYTRNAKISWCLIKAPTKAWADKVFADIAEEDRIRVMWDTIFQMNRVDGSDPIQNWQGHLNNLEQLQNKLNHKNYKSLHYRAPGTDLKIELAERHIWRGGGGENAQGIYTVANMPTEEVFTMPKRTGVNGHITSTMPLNLNGQLVDRITFTFKDGKVTEYTAESGEQHLTHLLATDEGACYLGEVALVPHDSPISNLNRIFYNTGIDENASCHLALGSAYPFNIENGTQMNREELLENGANVSLTHVDFMIGSAELDIDGELQDGSTEAVFRKGNWAI